jgi:hypothetical protein
VWAKRERAEPSSLPEPSSSLQKKIMNEEDQWISQKQKKNLDHGVPCMNEWLLPVKSFSLALFWLRRYET